MFARSKLTIVDWRQQANALFDCVADVLSLAYIGTASITEFGVSLRIDPRRFRLGDEKEAAGGGDAVIQAGIMDFEYGLGWSESVLGAVIGSDDDGN